MSMRRMDESHKSREEEEGSPAWMCSYCDMITILLACFIMLFALSNLDLRKFDKAVYSIQRALVKIPGISGDSYRKPLETSIPMVPYTSHRRSLKPSLEDKWIRTMERIHQLQKTQEIQIEGTAEGVRFSLAGRLLFDSGLAELKTEMEDILLSIAETLNAYPQVQLRLEGHTDAAPLAVDSPYNDHWRLAEARAMAVLAFLQDQGEVGVNRFRLMSCGNSRPRFPQDSPEFSPLNNRVEIVMLNSKDSDFVNGILELYGVKINPKETEFLPNR